MAYQIILEEIQRKYEAKRIFISICDNIKINDCEK